MLNIRLAAQDMELVRRMAQKAELGGVSRVRSDDRNEMLAMDQLVGQVGTLAVNKALFGCNLLYMVGRWQQNRFPNLGDGGSDVPGTNLDVKSSLMRGSGDPLAYNLVVRPAERHAFWVYLLALVTDLSDDAAFVWFPGWASDEELPVMPQASGVFAGAHILPATALHPVMPLRWWR